MQAYRNNGAVGAILDEYEKAISELKDVIRSITDKELLSVADNDTIDVDCRSIQTILTHVIRAGYGYAKQIRLSSGENVVFTQGDLLVTTDEYILGLDAMFQYTEHVFQDYPNIQLEEYENEKKMLTRWGQRYDVEQLMEHAIVHILRHRRQIERFLLILRAQP
jgi:uncharacterized damage-inducible protein DinB